jgi:uncharacterized membrane protein (DUF106 family)
MLILAVLVLVSAAFLCLPISMVFGQSAGVTINVVNPKHGAAGEISGAVGSQVTVQGTVNTTDGAYQLFFGEISISNGTATGNSVSTSFTVPKVNLQNYYNVTLQDVSSGSSATVVFLVVPSGISAIPTAMLLIVAVAIAISFINMVLNRALITKMIGWHEYRSMQKEMSEYNSQRMAALRSKDTKAIERLKKKESQIQSMQTKMFKPQLILIPITFIYLIIWPVLTGYFPGSVAFIPGISVLPGGGVPFFYWYLICSFFFGTIASRIIGVTPIQ